MAEKDLHFIMRVKCIQCWPKFVSVETRTEQRAMNGCGRGSEELDYISLEAYSIQ